MARLRTILTRASSALLLPAQLTHCHPSPAAHSLEQQFAIQRPAFSRKFSQKSLQLEGISVFDRDNTTLDKIDIASEAAFFGPVTFAHLPYVDCFGGSTSEQKIEPYDIAFLGAPFDTGVTARPGARFGPSGIRQASFRVIPDFAWDVETGENIFEMWAKIVDCGDAPMTPLDNTYALKQLEKAHRVIAGRKANSSDYKIPRIITLGGDHTTTLPALRSVHHHWGPVSVIHLDSHLDTWNPDSLGSESKYAGVNHGTFLHIAHEEGLILDSSIHAGIRGPVRGLEKDINNDRRCGFQIITVREIDRVGVKGIIDQIKKRVGDNLVYFSVDIDVLDPAFAPGTGTPEVGGWSTRELLSLVDGLKGINIVGADVVEVSPPYDNKGETTALAATHVAQALMGLMVHKPVKA